MTTVECFKNVDGRRKGTGKCDGLSLTDVVTDEPSAAACGSGPVNDRAVRLRGVHNGAPVRDWYLYELRSGGKQVYVGITRDPGRRVIQHSRRRANAEVDMRVLLRGMTKRQALGWERDIIRDVAPPWCWETDRFCRFRRASALKEHARILCGLDDFSPSDEYTTLFRLVN
jgi:hypothetical protein